MSTGTANFLKADLPVIKAQFEKDFKVTNVDAKIAEVTKLVDKWKGLTEKWNGDADALADIYWREVFSKIDAGKYGLD
jgi:TRAP-type transport system periplasmic protein